MRLLTSLLALSLLASGCGQRDTPSHGVSSSARERFTPPPPLPRPLPEYSWRRLRQTPPPITLYHLRCRGDWQNSLLLAERQDQKVYLTDCGGVDSHSLPLREEREFIYPILVDLLNYIQAQSLNRVIITSGHHCQEHHAYIDPLDKDPYSKHLIGAAVDFYVEGYTDRPQQIIDWLQSYYHVDPVTQSQDAFTSFHRYEKTDTDVSTLPWYNKEIFIKLYLPHEGRDGDNAHPYPYICLQVRWDRSRNEKVTYSWRQAFNNYYRY